MAKQSKYKAKVIRIDDNDQKLEEVLFVWTSPSDVVVKNSDKYTFVKDPEEFIDLWKWWALNEKDLLYFFEGISAFEWMDMPRLLELLKRKTKRRNLKIFLEKMKKHLEFGWKMYEIFWSKEYKKSIPSSMYDLIKMWEETQREREVFQIIVEDLRIKRQIRSKTISAMIYPSFVIVVVVALIVFLLLYLVPVFSEIFAWKEDKLPALTQSVFNTSEWLKQNLLLFFFSLIWWIFWFWWSVTRIEPIKRMWIKLMLKTPVIWWLIKMNNEVLILQLIHFWDFAVSAGNEEFWPYELWMMIWQWMSNPIYKDAIADIPEWVQKWNKLNDIIEEKDYLLTPDLIAYITFWEENQKLWEKCQILYRKYTEDLLNFYSWIQKVIEPLLIIIIAFVVWYILGWIIIWVFSIADTIWN